jgi:hypothetical protein
MEVETLSLVPYYTHGVLKAILEVLYVLMLLDRMFTLLREFRARVTSNQGEEGSAVLKTLKDVYWNEGSSNWLDLINIVVGTMLCVEWGLLVMNLRTIEDGLADLHRPSGEVQYDDTDSDVWSVYHHDIADIELVVVEAVFHMVLIVCRCICIYSWRNFISTIEFSPLHLTISGTYSRAIHYCGGCVNFPVFQGIGGYSCSEESGRHHIYS